MRGFIAASALVDPILHWRMCMEDVVSPAENGIFNGC